MIYIDKDSAIPLYMQIYTRIKEDILSEDIGKGSVLPGTRVLAQSLGVGRNTVNNAYKQLEVEGYIVAQKGVGFVVLDVIDNDLPIQKQSNSSHLPIKDASVHEKKDNYKYNFQFGNFPPDNFPVNLWRRYTCEILYGSDIQAINRYQDKQGDLGLRVELKKFLKRSRGVNCSEDQIVVGCGLHYLLEIVCKLIANKGKTIAFEEPGYHGSRNVFINNDYAIKPISVTRNGLDFDALQKSRAGAIYVTPSHQFPLGTVLTLQKRKQLLSWAVENNAYIIEDDYDSEFRHNTRPIPSLQSIDCDDCVIYIGTFSKSLSPSIRVNYMVLPNQLLPVFKNVFHSYQSTVSWLTQRILYKYLESGQYERHLRKVSLIYKKRHDILVQTITQQMGDKVIIHGRGAGMHIVLEFINGEEQDWLISRAKDFGIKVYSTMPYWMNKSNCLKNTLFIGFSSLDEKEIIDGITILNKAWFGNI